MSTLNETDPLMNHSFNQPGYAGGYPSPKAGETYRQYRSRVWTDYVVNGFGLGSLSNTDWGYYCMGSGDYQGVHADDLIFK